MQTCHTADNVKLITSPKNVFNSVKVIRHWQVTPIPKYKSLQKHLC